MSTADLRGAEPADGTQMVAEHSDGVLIVIYRDDHIADLNGCPTGARWWTSGDNDSDPDTWAEVLAASVRLYTLTPYASMGAPIGGNG